MYVYLYKMQVQVQVIVIVLLCMYLYVPYMCLIVHYDGPMGVKLAFAFGL